MPNTPLPSYVKTGRVVGRQYVVGIDTAADVDTLPDATFPTGSTLLFAASVPYLLFHAGAAGVTDAGGAVVYLDPFEATINTLGQVVTPAGDEVRLPANVGQTSNDQAWFWIVTPRVNGTRIAPFRLDVTADVDNSLTDALPIPATTPMSAVTRGLKGDPGAPGPGVPAGGKAGQVYGKASDADFDGAWLNGVPSNDARLTEIDGPPVFRVAHPYFQNDRSKDLIFLFDPSGATGPILLNPDIVNPAAVSFATETTEDQDAVAGFTDANGAKLLVFGADGLWHRWENRALVVPGDSMAGVGFVEALNAELSATLRRPIVDQAISGDLMEWITARVGAKPAAVTILDGRGAAPGSGTIPSTGSVNVMVSPELGANARPVWAMIGGVAGTFQPTELPGSPDPLAASDPGSIANNYSTGVFTRYDQGGMPAVVPDGTPLQTAYDAATGTLIRRHWWTVQPSRHNFFRRYQKLTITCTAAVGAFVLAVGTKRTAPIAWSASEATLAANIAAAIAPLGFTGTVDKLTGLPGQAAGAGQLQVDWNPADTVAAITLVAASPGLTVTLGHPRNGVEDTVLGVAAMLDGLTSDALEHSTVLDLGPFPGEEAGTPKRRLLDAANDALREAFGDRFFPVWALMRNADLIRRVTGQDATAADLDAIANTRMTPPTLLDTGKPAPNQYSGGHPGPAGARARFLLLVDRWKAQPANWIEGA